MKMEMFMIRQFKELRIITQRHLIVMSTYGIVLFLHLLSRQPTSFRRHSPRTLAGARVRFWSRRLACPRESVECDGCGLETET